jgi:hypothetical protein
MPGQYLFLLFNLLIETRKENKDFIDSIKINEGYSRDYVRMPFSKEEYNSTESSELTNKACELSKMALTNFFNQIEKDIKIDVLGHKPSLRNNFFKADRFVHKLQYRFACAILNMPDSILDVDLPFIEFLIDCGVLDYEDLYLTIYGDSFENACKNCGDDLVIGLDLNDLTIKLYEEHQDRKVRPCEHANKLGTHSVNVNILSGKIVVANKLSSIFSKEIRDGSDVYVDSKLQSLDGICCAMGRKHSTEYYARHGLVYIYGNNARPAIFLNKNKNLITVKNEVLFDMETDEEVDNFTSDEEKIGWLCMDLWATTAMDYDLFKKHCLDNGRGVDDTLKDLDATVIDVPVGTYKATSFRETDEFEDKGLFATIELES